MLQILLITLVTFISSVVGTITGFGSSTILVPVLFLIFPIPEALLLAAILHLCVDVWKILLFSPRKPPVRVILTLGISGAVVAFIATQLSFLAQPKHLGVLGLILLLTVSITILKPSLKLKPRTPILLLGGSLSGFLAGMFGIGGPTRSLLLTSFQLSKTNYLFTTGATAFIIDATSLIGYLIGGAKLHFELLYGCLIFIPITYLGSHLAKYLIAYIPPHAFRHLINIFLLIMGAHYLLSPWFLK